MTRAGRLGLIAAVCLPAALAGGLATAFAESPSPSPAGKVVLRLGWTEEPDTLNPYLSAARTSREIWGLVYDTLVDYDAATLDAAPGLATTWEHSSDGLIWTFSLRDGVRWQDGQPLRAQDVAWTYTFALRHDVPLWRDALQGVSSVKAVDDRTVRIRCSRPKADLVDLRLPVLPAHVWGKVDAEEVLAGLGGAPPLVGSGAFRIVTWRPGRSIRLVANDDYWGGRPAVDEVVFRVYDDAGAMADDLEAGRLDGAWGVPRERFGALDGGGRTAAAAVTPELEALTFNCAAKGGHPALRDAAVRRALVWAIDRDLLAETAYGPAARPAGSLLPAGLAAGPIDYHRELPEEATAFDPARARAALDAAGYLDRDDDGRREDLSGRPLELRLLVRAASPEGCVAAGQIARWLVAVGVATEVEELDDAALAARVWRTIGGEPQPDFDMLLWGWRGDIDPDFLLSTLSSRAVGGWNQSGWSSPAYDRLFREQAQTLDRVARRDLVWSLQDLIVAEAPVVPLVYRRVLLAYDTRHWSGWTPSPAAEGGVFCSFQIDSYLRLRPQDPGLVWGLPLWAAAAAAAAALGLALALAVVLWRRARR